MAPGPDRRRGRTTRPRADRRVADTGGVPVMDLNADLAEGDVLDGRDRAVLDVVTSASLACGFHAGSRDVMRAAAEACVERGVAIGAHVSYRDREGFGRRAARRARRPVVRRPGGAVGGAGRRGDGGRRSGHLRQAARRPLYDDGHRRRGGGHRGRHLRHRGARCWSARPAAPTSALARARGVDVVPEGFCDRGYAVDGRLVARGRARRSGRRPGRRGRAGPVAGRRRRRARGRRDLDRPRRARPCASTATGTVPRPVPGPCATRLTAAGVEVRAFAPVG